MAVEFRSERRFWLSLILLSASLILFAESIYLVKNFAILYGVGVGANVQSVYSGSQIVQSIQRISISASSFPIAIDISYVLSIISMLSIITASAMMLQRREKIFGMRTYGVVNTVSAIIYLTLLLVLLSEFYTYMAGPYMYVLYFGLALALASGVYFQYWIMLQKTGAPRRSVVINPAEPFSSMVALQEEVFSRLGGHLRIVDKHFNSTALTNLHRLMHEKT